MRNLFSKLRSSLSAISARIKSERANTPEDPIANVPPLLINRSYAASDETILYHYCSVETLKSISENKTLRFGDVNMMNDYAESSYGYGVFEEAANEALKLSDTVTELAGLDKCFLDRIDKIIGSSQFCVHPFVASLSKDPDVLSQWRAYADDGRGFAIGFSARMLKSLPVTLVEVEYDRNKQIEETRNTIAVIYLQMQDNEGVFERDCLLSAQLMSANLFCYKNPGFVEEKEVRCIHLADVKMESDHMRLVDAGGTSDGKSAPGVDICFRVANGAIIPYLDLPIPKRHQSSAIAEIYSGPANVNGVGNVAYLLGANGFRNVDLRRSSTTYRN